MYLLDTCIFSELIKLEPSNSVINWLQAKDENLLYVSSLTFGEIIKGIERLPDSSKRRKLETWFQEFMKPRFEKRLIAIDGEVAQIWGQLIAKNEKKGRVLPTIDSLIAATAISHHLSLVTRNVKDFEDLQLSLVNPWQSD